jgi:hypothetical protein
MSDMALFADAADDSLVPSTPGVVPEPGAVLVLLGRAFLRRQRLEEALEAFERAIDEPAGVDVVAALAGLRDTAQALQRPEVALRAHLRAAAAPRARPEVFVAARALITRDALQALREWL